MLTNFAVETPRAQNCLHQTSFHMWYDKYHSNHLTSQQMCWYPLLKIDSTHGAIVTRNSSSRGIQTKHHETIAAAQYSWSSKEHVPTDFIIFIFREERKYSGLHTGGTRSKFINKQHSLWSSSQYFMCGAEEQCHKWSHNPQASLSVSTEFHYSRLYLKKNETQISEPINSEAAMVYKVCTDNF